MASIRLGGGPSRIPGIPAATRPRGGRTADDAGGSLSHTAQKPRDREAGGPPTHGPTTSISTATPTTTPSRLPSRIPPTNVTVTRRTQSNAAPTIITRSSGATFGPATSNTTTTSTKMAAPQLQTPRRTMLSPPQKTATTMTTTTTGMTRSGAPPRQSPVDSRSIAVKPLRNTLRRKQSSVARDQPKEMAAPRREARIESPSTATNSPSSDPQSASSDSGYVLSSDRSVSVSPAEIRMATSMEVEVTMAQPITIHPEPSLYPELDRYRNVRPTLLPEPMGLGLPFLTTHDLPPPTPGWHSASRSGDLSATSSSPSTRFSESPGFGFYSRETTPTSTSSLSPAVMAPMRVPPAKIRAGSPTRSRPPVAWRRNGSVSRLPDDFVGAHDSQGLPSVRESMTSSSSGSTVRAIDDTPSPPRVRKQPPAPLEPPPRKSSYKSETESSKAAAATAASRIGVPPSRTKPKEKEVKSRPSPVLVQSPSRPLGSSTMSSRLRSPSTPTVITTPPTQTTTSPAAPARPSREGATGPRQGLPVPVVHSNLAAINTERRGSEPAIGTAGLRSATTVSLPDTNTQSAARPTAGPEATVSTTTATTATATATMTTPKTENKLTKPEPVRRHMRTPSPNTNVVQSRFPFFRRKTSTSAEDGKTTTTPPPAKLVRKGPAAGTGHEGYGRFGTHRRSSAGSAAGLKPMTTPVSSSESLASNLTTDPFLLERMAPVIIAGGEVKENRNISFDLPRSESSPSVPTMAFDAATPTATEHHTMWPLATPEVDAAESRRPSDASDMDALEMKPQNMARRSIQRLRQSIGAKSARNSMSGSSASLEMVEDGEAVRPSLGGRSITAPTNTITTNAAAAASTTTLAVPRKLSKTPKTPPQRKWNFFSWSNKQQQQQQKTPPEASAAAPAVPRPRKSHSANTSVSSVKSRPVAFYMMDADEVDPLDTGRSAAHEAARPQASLEAGRSRTSLERPVDLSVDVPPVFVEPWTQPEQAAAAAAAAATTMTTPTTPVPEPVPFIFNTPLPPLPPRRSPPTTVGLGLLPPEAVSTNKVMLRSGRPSRLAQVGRIPQVIRHDEAPVPPSPTKIFSRPFNRLSLQPVVTDGTLPIDPEFVAKGPSPTTTARPSTPECDDFYAAAAQSSQHQQQLVMPPLWTRHRPLASSSHHANASVDMGISLAADLRRAVDLFSFSPLRKDSAATSCTSSTSFSSIEGEVDEAAVGAATGASDRLFLGFGIGLFGGVDGGLTDDDVWHEYDDLIDDAAHERFARATSSAEWLRGQQQQQQQQHDIVIGLQTTLADRDRASSARISRLLDEALHEEERATTCSSVYSDDLPERLLAAFGGADDMTTPSSMMVAPLSLSTRPAAPLSLPATASFPSLPAQPLHTHSMSVDSGRDKMLNRGSGASYITMLSARSSRSSTDESPLGEVNLRVGSMSVSKWLTFGHVLFSPVRHSLVEDEQRVPRPLHRHSVLVLDGLDNDDWGFYAAETYPAATIFNLSPRAPLPQDRRSSTAMPLRPQNHHQVQYLSHLDRFPFVAETFRSVVYRFPAAAPESHYRNVVAEARRVLQPGGYMELAILDADLHNMGPLGRRAVRAIKEKLHKKTPHSNLTPAADLLVKQLGAQGFVDIKTCRVGVPVVSPRVVRVRAAAGKATSTAVAAHDAARARTLAEMMSDEGPAADATITRMVARVGRWWYHRCYEVPVGVDAMARSMWADRALLDECEVMATSLKLTVCFARVPEPHEGHVRGASV